MAELMNKGWSAGALIRTPDGPKPMGKLLVGDRVVGWDMDNHVFREQTVTAVRTAKGRTTALGCGEDQEILNDSGWGVPIWRAQSYVPPQTVVEITAEPDHNFVMDIGVISHNAWIPLAAAAVSAIGSAMSKGKSPTTTQNTNASENYNTTSTRLPTDQFASGYSNLMNAADAALANRQLDPYTGKMVAPRGALQQEANSATVDLARQLMAQGAGGYGSASPTVDTIGMDELRKLALDQLAGKYLMADSNPYLQSAIDMAQRQTNDNYLSQVLPQLRSQAALSGAYGGGRQGVVEARSAQSLQQTLADIATQMAYQNYGNERNIQQGSGSLLTQAQQIQAAAAANERANAAAANAARAAAINDQLRGIGLLKGVGVENQQARQAKLDAALQQFMLNRGLTDQFQGLDQYAQALGLGSGYGTTTQSGTSNRTGVSDQSTQGSMLADIIRGGTSGLALGSTLADLLAQDRTKSGALGAFGAAAAGA